MAERKVCPICDSPLPPGAKRCPVCNADLSLFEDVSIDDEFEIAGSDEIKAELLDDLMGTIVSEMKEGAEKEESAEETVEQFECPICGAMVDIDADVCPNCGAVFVEEEEQFQCPVCGAMVDADATFCPNCGARFVEEEEVEPEAPVAESPEEAVSQQPAESAERAEVREITGPAKEEVEEEPEPAPEQPQFPERPEPPVEEKEVRGEEEESEFLKRMRELRKREAPKPEVSGPAEAAPKREEKSAGITETPEKRELTTKEKYRMLPALVAEVKPLLIIARENSINVKKGKELIDMAVAAGRKRQIDDAIRYITEGKELLEESLQIYANHDIQEIERDIPDLKAPADVKEKLAESLKEAKDALRSRDLERAFNRLGTARRIMKDHSGDFREARRMLSELENSVMNAEYFFMDVSKAKEMLKNAKESSQKGDWNSAGIFAREGLEWLDSILPELIHKEMKKARAVLLEAKMYGKDISGPINILKHASIESKSGNYADALKYLRLFKSKMEK